MKAHKQKELAQDALMQAITGPRFIVRTYYRTSAPGCYGWHSRSETFGDEAAARECFDSPFKSTEFEKCLLDLNQGGKTRMKVIAKRRRKKERAQ